MGAVRDGEGRGGCGHRLGGGGLAREACQGLP